MKTFHRIQAALILGMLFLGVSGAWGEIMPSGLRFRDKRLAGVSYDSGAIVERLKRINAECCSRRLWQGDEAYQFMGSLSGLVPLDAAVIQQLTQMVDIMDSTMVDQWEICRAQIPTMGPYEANAGDSLAATVLVESEKTSAGLVEQALEKMTNEPQRRIFAQTLKEIQSRQAARESWKKSMEQKRPKKTGAGSLLKE